MRLAGQPAPGISGGIGSLGIGGGFVVIAVLLIMAIWRAD
jgi:hypothetical protein